MFKAVLQKASSTETTAQAPHRRVSTSCRWPWPRRTAAAWQNSKTISFFDVLNILQSCHVRPAPLQCGQTLQHDHTQLTASIGCSMQHRHDVAGSVILSDVPCKTMKGVLTSSQPDFGPQVASALCDDHDRMFIYVFSSLCIQGIHRNRAVSRDPGAHNELLCYHWRTSFRWSSSQSVKVKPISRPEAKKGEVPFMEKGLTFSYLGSEKTPSSITSCQPDRILKSATLSLIP